MAAVLSEILPETDILNYGELGIYKIVTGLKDSSVLARIHKKYLAPLIKYDRAKHSDYTKFISAYLKYDGHIKIISEKMYVHRNTVHYKIKKIEDLTGCDLSKLETKTYFLLALMNYNLASKQRA